MQVLWQYNFENFPPGTESLMQRAGFVVLGPVHLLGIAPKALDWLNWAKEKELKIVFACQPMNQPRINNGLQIMDPYQRLLYWIDRFKVLANCLKQKDLKLSWMLFDNERIALDEPSYAARSLEHAYWYHMVKYLFDCPIIQFRWPGNECAPPGLKPEPFRWWSPELDRDFRDYVCTHVYWPTFKYAAAYQIILAKEESLSCHNPLAVYLSIGAGYDPADGMKFKKKLKYPYDDTLWIWQFLKAAEVDVVILYPSPGDPEAPHVIEHYTVVE